MDSNQAVGSPNLIYESAGKKALDRYHHPKTGAKTLILPVGRPAPSATEREFDELTYEKGGMLVKRAEVTFKVDSLKSKISKIKPSQNKKFTVIQIVKDQHMYGVAELKSVEFIFFKND